MFLRLKFITVIVVQGGSAYVITTATVKYSVAERQINYATSFSKILNTTITTMTSDESYENNFSISKQNNNGFNVVMIRITGSNNDLRQGTYINYRAWGIA